jgi:hypothetical protein
MRKAIFLAIPVLGVVMVMAGTAGAHSAKKHKTKIVLTNGGPTGASGTVSCTTSPCPPVCLSKRKVTLFRLQNGASAPVGSGMTNARGTFRINAPLIAGYYDAKVAAKRAGTTSCAAATSIRYHF